MRDSPSLYTDSEVEAFIRSYPALIAGFGEEALPEDILDRLGIDTGALKVNEEYMGGCISLVVYELSPSYELVVDDNMCSGYRVSIRKK